MTFEPLEISVEASRPVELYTITLGVAEWRYTPGDDDYVIDGETFEPLAIVREAVEQNHEEQDRQLVVSVPATTPIVREYIRSVPGESATVRVERIQKDDVDEQRIVVFEGLLQSVQFEESGKLAKMSIRALNYAFSRVVPRMVYSGICNHVLYDARCKVVRNSFRLIGAVLAVSGKILTVSGASGSTNGHFNGGYVELTTTTAPDHRLILDHVGNDLTLNFPFGNSPLGQDVRVFAGCGHDVQTCKTKFNNVINFGGFPFVPTRNIFSTGLR